MAGPQTPQQQINALWDGAAAEYDGAPGHGMHDDRQVAAWKLALGALLPPAAPGDPRPRVLDAGTGTGVIALLVAELGYDVLGVDLSRGMLAHALRKARLSRLSARFRAADAIDPPGETGSYDAVINRHVLWTLTDPSRALRNWLRLLRPGGRLIVIDGLWGKTSDSRLGDLAAALPLIQPDVTLEDITTLVRDAGFSGVAVSDLAAVDAIERDIINDSEFQPHYVVTAVRPERRDA
jgi:SAM-dependent methyltransferase